MTESTTARRNGKADRTSAESYRFDTFRTSLLVDDMWFSRGDLDHGDRVPAFDLPTLDGGSFSSGALGSQPVLMIFGSRTCPVTESAMPRLSALHAEFADRIRFVVVNTREAHPGERIPQPTSPQAKRAHAEAFRDHHGIRYEVAVDDIDGSVHRQFSPKPNSAYLIRPDGTIAHRAHWANHDVGLRRAITATLAGEGPRGNGRAMIRPLMRAVGHLPGITRAGGPKVERDVWRAAPPLALLARLSTLLGSLPVDRRGPSVAIALVVAVAAVGVTVATVL